MAKKKEHQDVFDILPNYLGDTQIMKTNIYALDYLLKGGIELSSSLQLVGEAGTGKSTIALVIAKNICNQEKRVIYVDSEGSVTTELIESLGLQEHNENKTFIYIRESTFTNVEKYLDMLLDTDTISLVIIDSLAMLVNQGFTNLKNGISITTNNTNYATRPLVMFMSKYKSLAISKKFSLILVNQYRNKIDMQRGTILKEFGSKNVRYNSDTILRIGPIKSTSKHSNFNSMRKPFDNGTELEFEVIKSNKASPLESMPFYLSYGRGISELCNYLYALISIGVIQIKGSYYQFKYEDMMISEQGIKNFYNKILELNVDFSNYIEEINNYYKNL